MAEAAADIARCIDDERRNLEQNLSELRARATAAVDWREHVRQRPALMVAAALGGGVVLAQLGGRRRRQAGAARDPQATVSGGPLESILGALFTTAAAALVTLLSDAVPGLVDEYRQRTAAPSSNVVEPPRG